MSETELPMHLLEQALDDIVRTGRAEPGQHLLAELERRGEDACWQAVLLLLGLLATRPVYALPEEQGVERLRRVARTADQVTKLVLELMAAHRAAGADTAHAVWDRAPQPVRSVALLQLLIAVSSSIGTEAGCLTPRQTVALVKSAIPPYDSWL